MPSSAEFVAAGTILVGLVFYALSGGADFGGGVWDLLAGGPRARERHLQLPRVAGGRNRRS